jgi:hypothetical protein
MASIAPSASAEGALFVFLGLLVCDRRAPRPPSIAPLVSIGAGPQLCLLGWCIEGVWRGRKLEYEPLDWSAVRGDPNWQAAVAAVCGPVEYYPGVYIPAESVPGQLDAVHQRSAAKRLQAGHRGCSCGRG